MSYELWSPVTLDLTPRIRQHILIDAVNDVTALEAQEACPWPYGGRYRDRACAGCKRKGRK